MVDGKGTVRHITRSGLEQSRPHLPLFITLISGSDLLTVNNLLKKHQALESELRSRQAVVSFLLERSAYLKSPEQNLNSQIQEKTDKLNSKLSEVTQTANSRKLRLQEAVKSQKVSIRVNRADSQHCL